MHSLLERPVRDITLAELAAALAGAGDEDDRWEAKGGSLRPDHVFRPVAGLANRAGGLLILGARQDAAGAWTLDGCAFPTEPGTWVDQAVRGNLRPTPSIGIATFEVAPARHVALVRVEPHPSHLALTTDGRLLRREHGSTQPIDDGSELTRLVRVRSGMSAATPLDPTASPDDLADSALGIIEQGNEARLRSFVSGLIRRLPRAAQFAPQPELDSELDRLSAVAACLAQIAPTSDMTRVAVAAHHRAFDEALDIRSVPNAMPGLVLQRALLRNTRSLGALLVRLELWDLVRQLVDHSAPDSRIYPGWMTYVGVQEARALGRPRNTETLRYPIREAVATALRVASLRPDGADEHQILDAVLVFDMLSNAVELDRSDRVGGATEVSPDFALFDATPHRTVVARLVSDEAVRGALLPGRSAADTLQLLGSVDAQARRGAGAFGQFWDGIADQRVALPSIVPRP
ncbi:MAG: hypothetical protein WD399_07690 [Thermoleophilaceae bacterium]